MTQFHFLDRSVTIIDCAEQSPEAGEDARSFLALDPPCALRRRRIEPPLMRRPANVWHALENRLVRQPLPIEWQARPSAPRPSAAAPLAIEWQARPSAAAPLQPPTAPTPAAVQFSAPVPWLQARNRSGACEGAAAAKPAQNRYAMLQKKLRLREPT